MKNNNRYILFFSLIICIFTSVSLSWCYVALKEKREFNELIDKQKNILKAAGIIIKDKKQISQIYNSSVTNIKLNTNEKNNELLIYKIINKEDNSISYVYPIKGKGLWSTLEGYLAVYPDGDKVKGITFNKHGETPGLGAEIEKIWFTNNFINKKLYFNNQLIGIEVVKGKAKDNIQYKNKKDNMVDGISGATITGNGVTKMLKSEPKKYQLFFKEINNS